MPKVTIALQVKTLLTFILGAVDTCWYSIFLDNYLQEIINND